jgi:hypothetical protein
LPRRLAQKGAFALLLPVVTLSTNPLDITSLSQMIPEIIELWAYSFLIIGHWLSKFGIA